MKTKIIFFLSPNVTGAERVTITLAKTMDLEKYDVKFSIVGNSCGDIVHYIPKSYHIDIIDQEEIYPYIQTESPDIIFCSLIDLNPFVQDAAQKVGNIKIVLRNNYKLKDVHSDICQKAMRAYQRADMVIAQTDEMKQELIETFKLDPEKVLVIENPVDKEYIDSCIAHTDSPYPNDGKLHYCWVGRYDWIKGPDLLVVYFAKKRQEDNNISLYMIGRIDADNVVYQRLKEQVEDLGLEQDVHMVGFDDNPYRWMHYSDGLIISSRSEASSNVAREARYLNVPVIIINKDNVV